MIYNTNLGYGDTLISVHSTNINQQSEIGAVNRHPTKGKLWLTYMIGKDFHTFACPPLKLSTEKINGGNQKKLCFVSPESKIQEVTVTVLAIAHTTFTQHFRRKN